jgi:hypothetical protein
MSTTPHSELNYYLMQVFDIFMITAPNIGFIAQIIKFRKMKSSEGFSKFLSFILLMANILRIFFWFGKKFPTPLLYQSILMIIMQLFLLKECLKYANNPGNGTHNNKNNSKHNSGIVTIPTNPYLHNPIILWDVKSFWNWPYLLDYAYFLCLFSLCIGFISHVIGFNNSIYVEILGTASASVEAIIGIPQIIKNNKSKSTESLSDFMIYTWVIGDSIKTYYFLQTKSPLQLTCSGLFQLTMDLIILAQIIYYKGKKEIKYDKEYVSSSEENKKLKTSCKEIDTDVEELHQIVSIV